jgi:hypothetical protein
MNDERLISILCVQQWEKCKGELKALIALQGSRLVKYEGNKAIINREWQQLLKRVNEFVKEVEEKELHC